VDWRLFSPFRLKFRAALPGVEIEGDVFARTNLWINVERGALSRLESVLITATPVNLDEFSALVASVREIVPADLHEMLEPGIRFGPPQVSGMGKIVFDFFDFGVVTERFVDTWNSAGLRGAEFIKINDHPGLFSIEALFSSVNQEALSEVLESPFHQRKLPDASKVPIFVDGADLYRMPFIYGGFLVSERAVVLLTEELRDGCLTFLPLSRVAIREHE
jgi:hypothetical protein